MLRTIIAIVVILSSATSAWALKVVSQPERGIELTLANVTLPEAANGSLRYRTCETCDLATVKLTRATKYYVDRQEIGFDDFRVTAAGILENGDAAATTFVGVFVDVASQNVNRIALSRRKQ
jgi:hypothetical protein